MTQATLYTLIVDGYAPEIVELTVPLMRRWAAKCGWDFHILTERRWPTMPPVYEKLQLYDVPWSRGDDWAMYLDADALVHPDTYNPIDHLSPDTVMFHGADMAGNRWRYDGYFRRDGRHIGACNWWALASRDCRDLWHPLEDLTLEQAVANIFPIQTERLSGVIEAAHLIDDYVLSRNIARYGLKHTTWLTLQAKLGDGGGYFWHQYIVDRHQKVHGWTNAAGEPMPGMREVIKAWGL